MSRRALSVAGLSFAMVMVTALGFWGAPRSAPAAGEGAKQGHGSEKQPPGHGPPSVLAPLTAQGLKAAPVEVFQYDLEFPPGGKPELRLWRTPGEWFTIKEPSPLLLQIVERAFANPARHIVFAYSAGGNVGVRVVNRTGNQVLDALHGADEHKLMFFPKAKVAAFRAAALNAPKKPLTRPDLKNLLQPARQEEWKRYLAAFNRLVDDGAVSDFVSIHWKFANQIHHVKRFLPWHRLMLSKFEQYLQKYDPTVTIPYWDFAKDTEIPAQFVTWKPQVTFKNPFSGAVVTEQVTRNDFIESPPTPKQIQSIIMSSKTFNKFWVTWESSSTISTHDIMHGEIGATMTQPWKAVSDPIFWVFHAQIDRVWSLWQQQYPNDYPDIQGALAPWSETAADVRYPDKQLNYVYE